jgi:microcystin-dependent protein
MKRLLILALAMTSLTAYADIRKPGIVMAGDYVRGHGYNDTVVSSILADIGARSATVLFDGGTWSITQDVTIPANISVVVLCGTVFDISFCRTLTINGPFWAGPCLVFTGTGAVAGTADFLWPYTEWGMTGLGNGILQDAGMITATTVEHAITNAIPLLDTVKTNDVITISVTGTGITANRVQGTEGVEVTIGVPAIVGSYTYTTGAVPFGAVIAYCGSSAPVGWLQCNGDNISTNAYTNLFQTIGWTFGDTSATLTNFNVPDMRGMFVRGYNNGRTGSWADPDVATRTNTITHLGGDRIGTTQTDDIVSHRHEINDVVKISGSDGGWPARTQFGAVRSSWWTAWEPESIGGNETRPNNISLMYIIRAY